MRNLLEKILKKIGGNVAEAIRYVIAGGLTTIVNLGTYYIFYNILGWDITLSNILSIILSILFAYVVNKIIVFRSHCSDVKTLFKEFCKFVGGRLLMMAVEIGGVYLLVNILKLHPMFGKICTQVIVIIGNYIVSKFLVFKHTA